ncbi:ROK family transcriptional regulator [Paenibacillaceae bacterium WGS1546]|uniref:ROK family transcriptional regulator n=1 Tax=Cohnella sp. WGS1546 TaxID=3366810 RepID=UPI00372D2018
MKSSLPSTIRAMNKSLVLNVVRQEGPISRAQIAKRTNITRATVSDIVNDLIMEGAIFEEGEDNSSVGRKGILLKYNAALGFGVGVDIGGTKIGLALFDVNAELLARERIATYKVDSNEEFIELLVASIKRFIAEHGRELSALQVVGISTPGIVDCKKGIVVEGSPNLPGWENLELCAKITERMGVPAVLENDVRAALIGEVWKGQLQDVQSAVLVAVGTGIGSALLMDGNIIRGFGNAAGEIGYMMFERDHLYREWRNKGCFESLASGSGLASRRAQLPNASAGGEPLTAEEIFRAAREGDPENRRLVEEYVDYLAIAILNMIAVVNPEKVLLMGGLSNSADDYLELLNDKINKHTFSRTQVRVTVSEMKELAPLYGIAILALGEVQPTVRFLKDIKLV